jgi:hypothetical protein
MRKTSSFLAAVLLSLASCAYVRVHAQDASNESSPAKPKVVQAYRLDFSFNEFEGDKRINTRHYSMDLTSNESNEIKIGSRLPVTSFVSSKDTGSGSAYQYVDVGTSIWARLNSANGDEQQLVVRGEVSSADFPTQGSNSYSAPVVRQIKIEGSTLLDLGKPLLVGSADDPSSTRRFQLEVTVSKLR